MENITLCPMTRELCHELFREWENDPDIYGDKALYKPYVYDEAAVDRYFDSKREPSRVVFAVMSDGRPIGEVQLKRIDREKKECVLSIHMQNDRYKNKGCGTTAEKLAVRYAFERLGMSAVNADTVISNTRSQRVLEKAGFAMTGQDDTFRYYRVERQGGSQ